MVQIATIAESMPGSLKLCYGESDMPTPAFICEAADEAMRAGHTFYTHTAGYRELREAIAAQDLRAAPGPLRRARDHGDGRRRPWRSTRPSARSSAAATTPSSSPPPTRSSRTRVIMSGGEPRPASLARRRRPLRPRSRSRPRGDRCQHADADRQQPVESDRLGDHRGRAARARARSPSATIS